MTFYALSAEDKKSWVKNILKSMEAKHILDKHVVKSFSMSSDSSLAEELEDEKVPEAPKYQSRLVKKHYVPKDAEHRCMSFFSCLSC